MDEKYPGVSIVVLTYNGSQYIGPMLDSLLGQSYPKERTEIILVDNGSTDNTLELAKSRSERIRCVGLGRNVGFAAGNNEGVKYARHDYLAFLNQDTVCHREWLAKLVEGMQERADLGACVANIVPGRDAEIDIKKNPSSFDVLYFWDLSPFGYGRYRKVKGQRCAFPRILSGCSFLIHRKTIDELGYLFDEGLWMYTEDTDLSLRLYRLGKGVCAVREAVVYHLHDDRMRISTQALLKAASAVMNRIYVFSKNMGSTEFWMFFPFLFFGGGFKIFEVPMRRLKQSILFLPFCAFSMLCMIIALFRLPRVKTRKSPLSGGSRQRLLPIL